MKLTWDTRTNKVTSDAMPFQVAVVHEAPNLGAATHVVLPWLPQDTDEATARLVAWLLRRQAYPKGVTQAYPAAVKDGAS